MHRQETLRPLSLPAMRYIDVSDSEDVLRAIQMTDPDDVLNIFLHTLDRLILAAL